MHSTEPEPGPDPSQTDGSGRLWGMPWAFRAAAAWSWRALLLGAVVYFLVLLAVQIGAVVLALFVGLLVTALIRPTTEWLARHGLPFLAATWLSLLTLLVAVGLAVWYIVQQAIAQLSGVQFGVASGLDRLRDLLVSTTGLPAARVDATMQQVIDQVSGGLGSTGGALPIMQGTSTVAAVLAVVGLALFSAFWFVYDGPRVWRYSLLVVPRRHRPEADAVGRSVWESLGGYLRGVTIVASVNAVGIGLALVLLDVPMPLGLAALTFVGAFVPLVGALVTGLAAVLVAFAAHGMTTALLTLGAVILVQQLEGQVLSPLIMGRAVRLHPLVIACVIMIGSILYGLPGAVLAVPLTAALHAAGSTLRGTEGQDPRPAPTTPG